MKKRILILLISLFSFYTNAQVLNDTQMPPAGHWIYDDMSILCTEMKLTNFMEVTPITIGEIKFYFEEIDYDRLSDSGKKLYENIRNYLYQNSNILTEYTDFNIEPTRFDINLTLSPELYYKSNPDIDWTFMYYWKDNPAKLPVRLGLMDYVTMEAEFFLGKNYKGSSDPNNFTNVFYNGNHFQFSWPTYSYAAAGYTSQKWGVNAHIGRQGLQMGQTRTGSIIYNKTFETDAYVQFNLFTRHFKYNTNIVEIQKDKFMYFHYIDVRFFKIFKLTALEGILINKPFEIRFLNPFMVNHSFEFWRDYCNSTEQEYYNEGYACDYLGVIMECTPFSNLRIYFEYSMNELQLPNEISAGYLTYPDSQAFQLGFDINIPSKTGGWWQTSLEAVYCSPWLYFKQAPGWSLYRARKENSGDEIVNTWIGSPLGPDNFAVKYCLDYKYLNKWKIGFSYLFNIKGERGFDTFDKKNSTMINGTEIYTYYPYTKHELAKNDEERSDAVNDSRSFWMSGTLTYKNQIELVGTYNLNSHFSFNSGITYTFEFNNKHKLNNFEQGIELKTSVSYTIF